MVNGDPRGHNDSSMYNHPYTEQNSRLVSLCLQDEKCERNMEGVHLPVKGQNKNTSSRTTTALTHQPAHETRGRTCLPPLWHTTHSHRHACRQEGEAAASFVCSCRKWKQRTHTDGASVVSTHSYSVLSHELQIGVQTAAQRLTWVRQPSHSCVSRGGCGEEEGGGLRESCWRRPKPHRYMSVTTTRMYWCRNSVRHSPSQP